MNEKHKNVFFERDSVLKNTEEAKKDQKRKLSFSKYGRVKERSKKRDTRLIKK